MDIFYDVKPKITPKTGRKVGYVLCDPYGKIIETFQFRHLGNQTAGIAYAECRKLNKIIRDQQKEQTA